MLEGYEVAVATHKDRDHLHTHFVINSVNMETGYKYQQTAKDLKVLKEIAHELELKYNLTQVKRGRRAKKTVVSKTMEDYKAIERGFNSIKNNTNNYESWKLNIYLKIRKVLDKKPLSKDEFIKALLEEKVKVNWSDKRKYITFEEVDNSKHKVRDKTLNNNFSDNLGNEELMIGFTRNKEYQQFNTRKRFEDNVTTILSPRVERDKYSNSNDQYLRSSEREEQGVDVKERRIGSRNFEPEL